MTDEHRPPPPPPSSPAPSASSPTASSASSAPIVVDRASKWFGDLVAVSDVSFRVEQGVTALLGPNGAGKSTMLRMLAGLTPPSHGTVRVLGADPHRDLELTRRIGLVPQQETTFEILSAFEFVELAAKLHRLPDPARAARTALGVVELDPDSRQRVGTYSKGMRQRVKVAQAIVHRPEVIILDEPLTGLDPRQRLHMIDLFQRLGDNDHCVIVSSHVLDEVERFGSRVLVIAQGRLAAEGDFRAIRDLMDDRPHRVRVRTDHPRRVATGLLDAEAVLAVRVTGPAELVIDTDDVTRFRHVVALAASRAQAHLYEVAPLDDDLESVFKYLVGR